MKKHIILLLIISILLSCQTEKDHSKNKLITDISQYIDAIKGFSGGVLIAKNDTVLIKKTYGYAHIGHKVKNNVETKFNQGSIGKTFTALAILQLLEQNKLSLQDNVGKYLLDYPDQIIRDSVTITHLLTHTSGVPNYFAQDKFLSGSKDQFRTMKDINAIYEDLPMESKPGELFFYRNTNYILLGRIIEKITGLPYDNYLEQHIYKPASMKNTGNFDLDHPIENAAEGYTTSEYYSEKFKINIHTYPSRGNAAGGGYTTLDDLFNFTLALKENRLLSKKYTTLFTSPIRAEDHYGYGMQFPNPKEGTIFGHSGGHFGVGTEWRIYTEQGYTVIILTNKDADKGFLDARFYIQKLISGNTPSIERYFNTKEVFTTYYNKGFETAVNKIKNEKKPLNEFDFIMKGYDAFKIKDHDTAIAIFKLGVEAFPGSYDLYDSLGETYTQNDQITLAIQAYETSLKLYPDNNLAKEQLALLKQKL